MSTLDKPSPQDPSTISPKDIILRYGLIGGLVMVIYALLGFITGFSNPSSGIVTVILYGLLAVVAYIVIMVMGVRNHRDQDLGGAIKFGRAFVVAFFIGLIISVIGTIFNYVYTNFIEPDYVEQLVEQTAEMYERLNVPEAQAEEGLEQIKNSGEIGTQFKNLGFGAVLGVIISLIIAAIMKREPEPDV